MVYASLTNPPIGEKKKKEYQQLIAPHEVFLEAVPTTVILAILLGIPLLLIEYNYSYSLTLISGRTYVSIYNTSLRTIIFGDNLQSTILFVVTFTSSTFSASLGLARGLLTGVTRCIGPGGHLDGLLSGRFLIACLASGLILVTRTFIFSLHITVGNHLSK